MEYSFVIDTRETKFVEFFKELDNVLVEQLDLGDFIFRCSDGTVKYIIERKSVSDLYSSIKDGRYREQKKRLLANFSRDQIIYLIEGTIPYSNSAAYYGSVVNMLMRDKIHVFQTRNMNESIKFLQTMKKRFDDNVDFLQEQQPSQELSGGGSEYADTIKIKKKDNLTPQIFQIITLAQIPGMSTTKAKVLIDKYQTIENLIYYLKTYSIEELQNIKVNERRIGPKVAETIRCYLLGI